MMDVYLILTPRSRESQDEGYHGRPCLIDCLVMIALHDNAWLPAICPTIFDMQSKSDVTRAPSLA